MGTEALAARLVAGRTVGMLAALLDTRVFQFDSCQDAVDVAESMVPRRGLQATYGDRSVFILETFTRYRRKFADVVEIRASRDDDDEQGSIYRLGKLHTCPWDDLSNVRCEFLVSKADERGVLLEKVTDQAVLQSSLERFRSSRCAIQAAIASTVPQLPLARDRPDTCAVVPEAAREHAESSKLRGREHSVRPVGARFDYKFILDMPLNLAVDARPHRCWTCHEERRKTSAKPLRSLRPETADASHGAGSDDDLPIREYICSSVEQADVVAEGQTYFPVTDDDLREAVPGLIVCRRWKRSPPIYMTIRFLLEACQSFYECLNVRDLRRRLASTYAANALADMQRMDSRGAQPYAPLWQLKALQKNQALRRIVQAAFSAFINERVQSLRARQLIYNAQGLRHDGNFKLAKIIYSASATRKRPFSVVLGFCCVDGSLLQPPTPCETESWPDIERVLRRLLQDIKKERFRCGMQLLDSVPCFHSTDVFNKHRAKIEDLYISVWLALRVQSESNTPKAGFARRRLLSRQSLTHPCIVTGEPLHDILALRRLVSPRMNDASDFVFDWTDMVNRLSKADPHEPAPLDELTFGDEALLLSTSGIKLLKVGVEGTAEAFRTHAANNVDAANDLRSMLKHPKAAHAPVWHDVFGAIPPRGTLARLSRRLGATLPSANGYRNIGEMRTEAYRVKNWYYQGRKKQVRRRGIKRRFGEEDHAPGIQTVWTRKVDNHFRRLLWTRRLNGLWQWRRIARAYHHA